MNKTRRILIIAAAVVGILLIAGGVLAKVLVYDRTVDAPTAAVAISADDRVMIIAPHPDDETLGPGLLAKQAVKIGAKVKVVIVTEGDAGTNAAKAESLKLNLSPADYLELGKTRHLESLAAMKGLGVTDLVFMGFGDGSTNSLWRANWDDNNPRLAMNGKTAVPYDFAYCFGELYSGNSLAKNLSAVVTDFNPTVIFYPTPEDLHHDHWAVNAFTQYVLAENNMKPREYTYLVHRGILWPSPPLYRPQNALQPPSGLAEIDASWIRYKVDEAAAADKLTAVNKYRSQTRVNGVWLRSFIRTNELFALYPSQKTSQASTVPSFEEGKKLPGLVINDYESFALSQQLGGKGDISRFAFAYDKDFAFVAVEFKKPQAADVVTMMNMRFFTSLGVNRLDVKVLNGEAKAVKAAENSVMPMVELVKNTSVVVIKVPVAVMGGAKTMMLNVDTFRDNESEDNWLDRTVWRRIELSN
ncbi:MAG: PIG-L family deacetylase [Actinomycetota bacterium]